MVSLPRALLPRPIAVAVLLLVLALAGCRESDRLAWVDRLLVSEADIGSQRLGLTSERISDAAREALQTHGRIGLAQPGARGRGDEEPWHGRIELVYVRTLPPIVAPAEPGGIQPMRAEVAVEISLTRGAGTRIVGEGRAQQEFVSSGGEEARERAFARALESAMADAARQLALHLETATRPDEALVADLSASDPLRREFALRVLADRKSPVVVPHLIDRLGDADRAVQLRAVGGLVAVGDRRAVPALIDATLGRDPTFVVQVVYALGEIGGDEAEAFLFTAANGHDEEMVRRAAGEALEGLRSTRERQATASRRGAR